MKWLRLLAAVVLLAIVWHLADGEKAWARLQKADPLWLLLAFLALHGQTVLSALRWRLVADALGQRMTAGVAIREYYVAQVVNQTVPGGVLGDGARAVRTAPAGGVPTAITAVVLERALGQVTLLAVMVIGFGYSATLGQLRWPSGALILVAFLLAIVAVSARFVAVRKGRLLHILRSAFFPSGRKRHLIALSLAIVALNLLSFCATARATGTTLTTEAVVTLIPLILTAMVIPLSIGGWGWREGAAAALFPIAGAAPDAGLVASATYGALILMAALPGLLWSARPSLRPHV